MSYGERVFALLSADATIAAKVGSRIYPQLMPQDCPKPAVVYTVVSDVPLNSFDGHTSGLSNARVQVDVYSYAYKEAQETANAIEALLGSHVTVSLSSLRVSRRDLYENSTKLHRVSMDFSLWGEE